MIAEQNPIWAPIEPAAQPLWRSAGEVVAAFQRAERPVRSQRYSLVMTEAQPEPARSKP